MNPKLECGDCKQKFDSGKEFSDHFTRDESTSIITGCHKPAKAKK